MKTQIKNLVKSALLGVAVLGGAIAMQSFTAKQVVSDEVEIKENTALAPNFLVNKGTSFSPRSSVNTSTNCIQADSKSCVYELTEEGMENVPDQGSYTPSQIEEYESNGWISPHPQSASALYLN